MITPQPGQANQMRSSAGSCSSGHHCSKHFPLDVGFLLCLAATQGCLNFSQRQIFIHQSVQCSTGQAWEGEGTSVPFHPGGCVCFPLSFPPRPVRWGRSRGHLSAGSVLLSRACARGAPGAASRGGPPSSDVPACSFNSSWKVYS